MIQRLANTLHVPKNTKEKYEATIQNTHELYYLQRILYGGAKEVIYKDGY